MVQFSFHISIFLQRHLKMHAPRLGKGRHASQEVWFDLFIDSLEFMLSPFNYEEPLVHMKFLHTIQLHKDSTGVTWNKLSPFSWLSKILGYLFISNFTPLNHGKLCTQLGKHFKRTNNVSAINVSQSFQESDFKIL